MKLKRFANMHLDDALILIGIVLIVVASSILSVVAGLFTAGVAMIVMGVLIGLGTVGDM